LDLSPSSDFVRLPSKSIARCRASDVPGSLGGRLAELAVGCLFWLVLLLVMVKGFST
jgi:hypothetical protein